MEGWLKGLIAAACVVVIAQGVYFGWQEAERQIAIHEVRKTQQQAKDWADAQAKKLKKLTDCKSVMDQLFTYETFDLPQGKKPKAALTAMLRSCAADNLLSAAHLAEAKPYL